MEMVDIIDEQGNILYQTSKKEAHEKGLLHKTVIAEVINSQGQMVMIKQTPDRQDPGKIINPIGGHVSAGESDDEALKREAEEELGLKDFKFKLINQAILNREVLGRKENHLFILYEIYTDQEPVAGQEVESFQKFTKEELKEALQSNPDQFGTPLFFVVDHFYPELKN
jgi:isopentenyldiphosphate isomerase